MEVPGLLEKILTSSSDGIVLSDCDNKVVYVNPAFEKMTGYKSEDIKGMLGSFLRSGLHDDAFYFNLWETVKKQQHWQGEMWIRRKNGEVFLEWLSLMAIVNQEGIITHYLTIFSDITERKSDAERIQYLVHHDPLTHLANRAKAIDYLASYLHKNENSHRIALFYIDLNGFRKVNTLFGLFIGDRLLQQTASRLQTLIVKNELVARIASDEFLFIAPELNTNDEIIHIGQKIIEVMQPEFQLDAHKLSVSVSIGISIFPTDGEEANKLIKHAETAMTKAKKMGGINYQFFTQELNILTVEYLTLEHDLHQALKTEAFELYYQPLINMIDHQICGVEALLRWQHPTGKRVAPDKFIAIAEETGLIIPLTEWVLRRACSDNMRWQAAGLPKVSVAVNISVSHFRQRNFPQLLLKVLQETGLSPSLLKLEITESILLSHVEESLEQLQALKEAGIYFSLDDFGTGYSSLSYLKRLPIKQIKIDQSFIRDLEVNIEDREIIRAIINLAKSLKLTVVAEGVETKKQLEFLREHQCDIIQGYYFSEPVTADAMRKMLQAGNI